MVLSENLPYPSIRVLAAGRRYGSDRTRGADVALVGVGSSRKARGRPIVTVSRSARK
jgi:hypothetical protein